MATPGGFYVPQFQNQDDVNLYITQLISENEALKKDLKLTSAKWQQTNSSIKRSHSFQPSKSDEKDKEIETLANQVANLKKG